MASSMVLKVACLAMMMCMVLGLTLTEATHHTCGKAQVTLSPCLQYLQGSDSEVPEPCCNGIKKVNHHAKTTNDRESLCECIKTTIHSLGGLNHDKLADLPGKCGVELPYKLSHSIDCDKIN